MVLDGRSRLKKWLNKHMRVVITDGRVLKGQFLSTDRDSNVILGSCNEYTGDDTESTQEPRHLGLAMIPGKHIVSMEVDESSTSA